MKTVNLVNGKFRFSMVMLLCIIAFGAVSAQDMLASSPASLPPVLILTGTGYVPLQSFAEIIGAQIETARLTVTVTYKGKKLVLRPGNDKATIDGADITLAGAVVKRGDAHYIPFKSVVRAFEMDNPTINPANSTTNFTPLDAETPIVLPYEVVNMPMEAFTDQDTEVYLAAIDGKNAKRLTYDLSDNSLPSISPDGKIIIYTRNNSVVGRFLNSATEFPLLTSHEAPGIPTMAYIQPRFLMDGTILAGQKMVMGGPGDGMNMPIMPDNQPGMVDTMPKEIILTEADGSNPRMLVSGENVAVSSDNKIIAFQRLNLMTMGKETYIYSIEATQEMNLGSVSDPVFHPKDKLLLLSRQYPTAVGGVKWGLVTYGYGDPKKAAITQMPAALQNDNSPITAKFSPDGNNLVMEKPGQGIFISKIDFSGSVQLTQNGQDRNASYTPDGDKILFIRDNHLYSMNLDGQNARQLVLGTLIVRNYTVTPNGKNIFITATP